MESATTTYWASCTNCCQRHSSFNQYREEDRQDRHRRQHTNNNTSSRDRSRDRSSRRSQHRHCRTDRWQTSLTPLTGRK